jgi:hypothetical protein
MNAAISRPKPYIPKAFRHVLMLLLFISVTSILSISQDRYQAIDYHLSAQLKDTLGITTLGNVQSIETLVIGPYTWFQIRYFEHNKQVVNAEGYQILGFKPVFSCISGHSKKIC